jgi:hypothetical protein
MVGSAVIPMGKRQIVKLIALGKKNFIFFLFRDIQLYDLAFSHRNNRTLDRKVAPCRCFEAAHRHVHGKIQYKRTRGMESTNTNERGAWKASTITWLRLQS